MARVIGRVAPYTGTMHTPRFAGFVLIGALSVGPAVAAPRGTPESALVTTAARLATARDKLEQALGALDAAPTRERIAEVHRAMDDIREGLRVYFHGRFPIDEDGRTALRAVRAEVMRLLGGVRPVVVVAHDVLRFHPTVHRQVARICQQVGEFQRAAEHLRAVQAIEGSTRQDLEALVAAYRAAGDERGASGAAAELRALTDSASAIGVP